MTDAAPILPKRFRAVRADKSRERIAIELALQAAGPLTRDELAARCNLPGTQVQTIVYGLCRAGYAHRIEPPEPKTPARFAWGMRPPEAGVTRHLVDDASSRIPMQPYEAKRDMGASARPGAMDAFRLPSMENGQRVPRRAPTILASSAVDSKRSA